MAMSDYTYLNSKTELDKKRAIIEEEKRKKEEEERRKREEEAQKKREEEERRQHEEEMRVRQEAIKKKQEEDARKKIEESARTEEERKARENQLKQELIKQQQKEDLRKANAESDALNIQNDLNGATAEERNARTGANKEKNYADNQVIPHLYYDDGDDTKVSAREAYSNLRRQDRKMVENYVHANSKSKGKTIAKLNNETGKFEPTKEKYADKVDAFVENYSARDNENSLEKTLRERYGVDLKNVDESKRAEVAKYYLDKYDLDTKMPDKYDKKHFVATDDKYKAETSKYNREYNETREYKREAERLEAEKNANKKKPFWQRNASEEPISEEPISEETEEVTSDYSIPDVNERNMANIQRWLDPSYKLKDVAKAEAKKLIDDYELQMAQNPGAELTPEQREYEQAIFALKDKLSWSSNLLSGIKSAIPGLDALDTWNERRAQNVENQIAEEEGREAQDVNRYGNVNARQNAAAQNPLAYYGGLIGTGIAGNVAGQQMLGATKYGQALENGVKSVVGDNVGAKVLTDALMDAPVDLALDTLPQLLNDMAEGKSGGEVAKNTALNLLVNAGLNTGAAVLGNGGDILNALKKNKSANGVDDAIKNFNNAVNSNGNTVFPEVAEEMAGGVPRQIVDENIVNSQLARDFDELNNALPEQTAILNARQGMANRIAEEARATQNNDMDILRRALAEQNVEPTVAENIVRSVDNAPVNQADNVIKNAEPTIPSLNQIDNVPKTEKNGATLVEDISDVIGDKGIKLSAEDIASRNMKEPLTMDEIYYFAKNDSPNTKTVKINGASKGGNITSTIRSYGGSPDLNNEAHNAFAYAQKYMETGDTSYLDRAQELIDDIDFELRGAKKLNNKGQVTPKSTEYTDGWISNKWSEVVADMKQERRFDNFSNNSTDAGRNAYKNLSLSISDDARVDDLILSIEETLENPSVESFNRTFKKASRLEKDVIEGTLDGNPETIRDDVKALLNDLNTRYSASATKSAGNAVENTTKTVAESVDNTIPELVEDVAPTSKNVNMVADNGNMTPNDVNMRSNADYRTSNADVNDRSVDIGGGSPTEATFDVNGEMRSYVDENGNEYKVNKTRDNTLMNQRGVSAEEKELTLNPAEEHMHVVNKRGESVQAAFDNAQNNLEGMERTYLREGVRNNAKPTENDADNLFAMADAYRKKRQLALDSGDQVTADAMLGKINATNKKIEEYATKSGQFLRALCDYADSADGSITAADAIVARKMAQTLAEEPRVAKAADKAVSMVKEDIEAYIKQNGKNIDVETVEAMMENAAKKNKKIFKNNAKQVDFERAANQVVYAVRNGGSIEDGLEHYRRLGITGYNGISDATRAEITRIFDGIKDIDYNSKEYVKEEARAYATLANELNMTGSFADKVATWRYFSMLANPKTHLRNVVGNTLFGTTTRIKDDVAAIMEAAFIGKKDGRTKSILNNLSANDRALKRASKENADEVYRLLTDGNKYTSADEGILDNISTWKNKGLGKVANGLTDANTSLLDFEDTVALKSKYADSLARYLKANRADSSIFSATDEASKSLLEKAQQYAINEAKYATFHNNNVFATTVSNARKNLKDSGTVGGKVGQLVLDSLVPFAKTPSNVVNAIASYSPLNTVKVLGDLRGLAKGTKTASDVIDDMAKTMTGTALFGTGYWMAKKGLITADADSDNNTLGKQNYALNIGDGTYTIDNFAPVSAVLLSGAALAEQGDDKEVGQAIADALTSSFNPVIETSMLQNFADTLTMASYADTDNPTEVFGNVASQIATGYATQGVPTELGNIARGIDNKRYSTYSDESGIKGTAERTWNSIMNKSGINSVLSALADSDNKDVADFAKDHMNYEYVDRWGNTRENYSGAGKDSVVARELYQNLSPGYYSKNDATELDYKLNEIGAENEGVKTGKQSWSYTDKNGETVTENRKLTPKEYYTYSKKAGDFKEKALTALFDNEKFSELEPEQQKKIANEVMNTANRYGLARAVGKKEVFESYIDDKNAKFAYEQYGAEGFANYEAAKAISKAYAGDEARDKYTNALGIIESGFTDKQKLELLKNNDRDFGDMTLKEAELYYRSTMGTDRNKFMMENTDKGAIAENIAKSKASDKTKLGALIRNDADNENHIRSLYDYGGANLVGDYYEYKDNAKKNANERGGSSASSVDKIAALSDMKMDDNAKGLIYANNVSSISLSAAKAYETLGNAGIYYWYDISTKSPSTKKADLQKTINNSDYPDDVKKALLSAIGVKKSESLTDIQDSFKKNVSASDEEEIPYLK